MPEETRRLILFLIGCMIVLGVGFRAGEIYNRIKNKPMIDKVQLVEPIPPAQIKYYYIAETGRGGETVYHCAAETNVFLKLLYNEKLRHLLKLKNIQIYSEDGERLY